MLPLIMQTFFAPLLCDAFRWEQILWRWTALTWYTVIKTAYRNKNLESESFADLYYEDFDFKSD